MEGSPSDLDFADNPMYPPEGRSTPPLGLRPIPFSFTMVFYGFLAAAILSISHSTMTYVAGFFETQTATHTADETLDPFETQEPIETPSNSSNLLRFSNITRKPIQNLFTLLIASAVWAFLLLPISRCAVIRCTLDLDSSIRQVFDYTREIRRLSFHYPLLLLSPILGLVLINGLIGLAAQIPWIGPLLLIPLYALVLVTTLVFALLLFGGILGVGVASASIVTENESPLNAISRTFSYLFARPLHFIFYHAVVLLFAGFLLWFGSIVLNLSRDSLGVLFEGESLSRILAIAKSTQDETTTPTATPTATEWLAGWTLFLVVTIGKWLSTGAGIAFFFSGSATIYLRLRHDIDGIDETDLLDTRGISEQNYPIEIDTPSQSASGENKVEEEGIGIPILAEGELEVDEVDDVSIADLEGDEFN